MPRIRKNYDTINNIPYTYLIGWGIIGLLYYGRRTTIDCHPDEFWVTYFTSSKWVLIARYKYGEPDIREIRQRFTDEDYIVRITRCCKWEDKFLKKVNAVDSPRWLNKSDGTWDYHSSWGECRWCDRIIDLGSLAVHEQSCVENPERVERKCQFCYKEISGGNSNLTQHEVVCSHNPNKKQKDTTCCRHCGKAYIHPGKLASHETFCDSNPNKKERPRLDCPFCDTTFTNPGPRKQHIDICVNNPNRIDPTEFTCQYCQKIYYDKGKRNEHELYCSENADKIQKPVQYCQYCGKGLTGHSNKVIHERTCKLNPNKTISTKPLDLLQAKFVPLTV